MQDVGVSQPWTFPVITLGETGLFWGERELNNMDAAVVWQVDSVSENSA